MYIDSYNPLFILKKQKVFGYRFLQRTWYGILHRGVDWKADYEPLYAPTGGWIIRKFHAPQMGNQIHFLDRFGWLHRFGHLSGMNQVGEYNAGDLIGITGNSGLLTTDPHLHHDISTNGTIELFNIDNFYDPLLYFNAKIKV